MPKILITAGATRNPIDSMRYVSANASGRTGVLIAESLNEFDVLLLGSPIACLRADKSIVTQVFGSTTDLMNQMLDWIDANPDGIVIHSAAVGDFQVSEPNLGKISSQLENLNIEFVQAPKILPKLKALQPSLFVVSFKAAPPNTTSEDLQRIADKQRLKTNSDIVFANVLGRIDTGIYISSMKKRVWFAERDEAIQELIDLVRERCRSLS